MAVYMVAYDLQRSSYQEYENLHALIKSTGYNSIHLQLSTFLVATNHNAVQIRDYLAPAFGKGEKLVVAQVNGDISGQDDFSLEIQAWLNTYFV
jgi:sulfur carrier protein ThiS